MKTPSMPMLCLALAAAVGTPALAARAPSAAPMSAVPGATLAPWTVADPSSPIGATDRAPAPAAAIDDGDRAAPRTAGLACSLAIYVLTLGQGTNANYKLCMRT